MPTRPKSRQRLYGTKPKERSGYVRKRSDDLYHTSKWTRLSKAFRISNPLCVMCQAEDVINEAEVVDHIIPYPVCGDFFDSSNWQSLCKKHNLIKGNKDKALINRYKNETNV